MTHRALVSLSATRAAHHQSERLARELETRNAELERAKEALEAGNAALESRVAARTAELEAANQRLRAFSVQAADLAVEQERTRVAREIHDGLGHHLDAIKIHVEVPRPARSVERFVSQIRFRPTLQLRQKRGRGTIYCACTGVAPPE